MSTTAFDQSAGRPLRIGLVSASDRASSGIYEDRGIPALTEWFARALTTPYHIESRLVPDEGPLIEAALVELGGTGPARRDVTPEATRAVGTKEMPGFGEQMRRIGLEFVPTAVLSRQVAAIREIGDIEGHHHAALIINLPGQPKAIKETLEGLKDADGKTIVPGIFAAVPYCIDLIGGPWIETDEAIIKAFRPKSALKKT